MRRDDLECLSTILQSRRRGGFGALLGTEIVLFLQQRALKESLEHAVIVVITGETIGRSVGVLGERRVNILAALLGSSLNLREEKQ